jgi:hypothetical protein
MATAIATNNNQSVGECVRIVSAVTAVINPRKAITSAAIINK